MKINVTIEIDDEELKKIFNLKSEEECPKKWDWRRNKHKSIC